MTLAEFFTVVASLLALVVTVAGWVWSGLAQAETQKQLEKYQRAREARDYLVPNKLARLDRIEAWIVQGQALARKRFEHRGIPKPREQVTPDDIAEWEWAVSQDTAEIKEWAKSSGLHYIQALQLDPLYNHTNEWQPGSLDLSALPTDLVNIIQATTLLLDKTDPRDPNALNSMLPYVGALYFHAASALERVRKHVIDNG